MDYSESLVNFISGIVTDAVLGDGTLSHLKYLERYCRLEESDYGTLAEGLGVLVDALRTYRRKKSKVSLKLAKHQAGLCGLPEEFVESLADMPAPPAGQASPAGSQPYYGSYMRGRGGDIFDEMPGGNNLKQKEAPKDVYDWRKYVKAVDLGLPSGTKWASCNLGATSPEEWGDYYAWGEIKMKEEDYGWDTYSLCDGYKTHSIDIGSPICGTQYDPAHLKWGDGWKMPTSRQFRELLENCTYQWINTYNWETKEGRRGALFTSKKNGNSIFLPDCGAIIGWRRPRIREEHGNYWSATRNEKTEAFYLWIVPGQRELRTIDRCYGQCIRPVLK